MAFFALSAIFSALYAGPSALRAAREGRAALVGASRSFLERDAAAAGREFNLARDIFRTAESRLSSPLLSPMRIVPVVSTHLGVGRSLASVGRDVAGAGLEATAAMGRLPDRELKMVDGRVDLSTVRRANDAFGRSVALAADIRQRAEQMPASWVIGPLARARAEARALLPKAVDGLQKGQAALEAMPSLFAETGLKRYVIAFSNLSELRGSGGFIGFVTVLKAENGALDLEDVSGRPTELFPPPGESQLAYPAWFPEDFRTQAGIFQNINLTTDFPTVGDLIVQTASQAIGKVDGVIAVDPVGIGAVLSATGPISVPSWPDQITSENVSRIAQHDVYVNIPIDDQRQEFFSQLVRTAFDRLTTLEIALRPETFGAFDAAVRAGHFRMYSAVPDDQRTFQVLGLAGGVDRARTATDVVSLVSENATGNKADWFLHREVTYRVRLNPGDGIAEAELQAVLRNEAPSTGLPDYVIGSPIAGLQSGTNRQILVLLRSSADRLSEFEVGDSTIDPEQQPEGHLLSYRSSADVPPESSTGLRVRSTNPRAFGGAGRQRTYRLHVLPQPVVNADRYDVVIDVPRGWRAEGLTRYSGPLIDDVVLEVKLTQGLPAWLYDRVVRDPWRIVGDLFGRVF